MSPDDDLLATRVSLLGRLNDWADQASWQEFFDTYWRLIYGVARKAGLSDAEAQDVVQETVLSVARGIGDFRSHPDRGSFKGWLLQITRRRVADLCERRARQARLAEALSPAEGVTAAGHAGDETSRTATIDRLPDPAVPDFERHWEEEWRQYLYEHALAALRDKVPPEQYQMFDLYVRKGLPVRQVASLTGVSAASVYLAKHRLTRQLRREIERLEQEWREPFGKLRAGP